jgi:hypothetical protein
MSHRRGGKLRAWFSFILRPREIALAGIVGSPDNALLGLGFFFGKPLAAPVSLKTV